ncbi:ABC transporter permease [Pengzhenrongella sp.]|jgi:glycine betaine/proline transport system permease protein|uniref:ABC transporter permease n=1 Tax=Pengzhenrongella sp. TaxID=2888820 RepID=UPI002F92A099
MATITEVRKTPSRATWPRWLNRRWSAAITIVVGLALYAALRGRQTLHLAQEDTTPLHDWLNSVNDAVGAGRQSNPLFLYFFNEIRAVISAVATFFQVLLAQPFADRTLPVIGWLGVVAIVAFGTWAVSNGRMAILATSGFLFLGLQGLWQESMDTLSLTITAVIFSLLVGLPLGIWAGISDRANAALRPVLDFMQTMPTFVYLAPLVLLFAIGPASATIATLIYAAPPVIRITSHGIREVPRATLEAAEAMGSTRRQILVKVMLPMARRTIVIGINQTVMAALSMVTLAALIDAPGLGQVVLEALNHLDIGTAFNGGLAIVIMAIVIDRVTTAAAKQTELARRRPGKHPVWLRRLALAAGAGITAACVYLSYVYVWAAQFPTTLDLGTPIRKYVSLAADWIAVDFGQTTNAVKNGLTFNVLNPMETLLTEAPWWLAAAVIVALAAAIGSRKSAATAAACLGLILATGLWSDAMSTLVATLVGTVVVLVIGIVVGTWMGRSANVDRVIRPVLDAAQTMPAFVYLVPFVALFAASRFTGIVAAIVYAAPIVIKIVADGIAGVPAATMEAATAAGSSKWQLITKVQLPMSRRTLALAMNQGLIYVLSMIVIGGLVGAGALGFDVVSGFRQDQWFGKGLAAGLAIVLLGIMLDRITQAIARRSDRSELAAGH